MISDVFVIETINIVVLFFSPPYSLHKDLIHEATKTDQKIMFSKDKFNRQNGPQKHVFKRLVFSVETYQTIIFSKDKFNNKNGPKKLVFLETGLPPCLTKKN